MITNNFSPSAEHIMYHVLVTHFTKTKRSIDLLKNNIVQKQDISQQVTHKQRLLIAQSLHHHMTRQTRFNTNIRTLISLYTITTNIIIAITNQSTVITMATTIPTPLTQIDI